MKARAELHLHTDNSMLDGLGKIPAYVEAASKRNVTHLAITDHGTLSGTYEFYVECLKHGIEPILGLEAYFVPSAEEAKQFKDSERYHITILAIGEQGYRILKEVNNESHRNFYYKPLIDRHLMEQLGDAAKHLWVLSGCAGSILSQRALYDGLDASREELEWWLKVFPHFATELQYHGTKIEAALVKRLRKLARMYELPIVATNDCHYVNKRDWATHDALLAIQTASNIDDPDRFRFDGSGYHLRSRSELRRAFGEHLSEGDWRAAATCSLTIARECRTRIAAWDQRTWHIPKFPDVDEPYRELVRLVRRGLRNRGLQRDNRYVLRARHELRKIKQVGIADFMLIVREHIVWAKRRGIRVGAGRGSVAGCLVAYLIGIHSVDSVRYKLKFERFLNPERPKMPDVDSDFQPSRRDEVFGHLTDKYGLENTMRVAAYQTMKPAGAFRKLGAAHGIEWTEINRISKILNPVVSSGDEEDEEDWSFLPDEIAEAYPDLHKQIVEIIGTKSAISQHAAGMLIFSPDDPVKELIPHQWITDKPDRPGFLAGAFDLHTTEKIGLMKMDELGVRTLDTIETCVQILKNKGVEVEPEEWIPDSEPGDADVYRSLREGRTAGVFQMEGGTNSRGIAEVRCNCFEDIVSTTSLYRAGPIGNGADKRYIANKRANRVRVLHPKLRPILEDSWGEMIYQEQMMDICHEIAGFTWVETDDVKETVRFKDPERMKAFKDKFISGCEETSGFDHETAEKLWATIETQSTYLFNRCLIGDTVLYRTNYTHTSGEEITIGDLWRIWHGPNYALSNREHSLRSAYRRRGLSIRSYKDGFIKRAKVKNVYRNGPKPVWEITLANGMTISSTANHRHLSSQGWKRTDHIRVGTKLLTDSRERVSTNGHVPTGMGRNWNRFEKRRIASDGRNRPYLHGNSAGLKAVTALLPDICEFCGSSDGRLERAHLNGDRSDNSRENVKLLCNSCHKQHDWDTGQRVRQWDVGCYADYSRVVSIRYAGKQMTYDLEMDDEDHNFVANGIVTHNSHAVAYSLTTYQTARLKFLYPLEFMTAYLATVEPKNDSARERRAKIMAEAYEQKFQILPPDVNVSGVRMTCANGSMMFGFTDIKGIGTKTAEKIVDIRSHLPGGRFRDTYQISALGKRATDALAAVGALEAIGGPRRDLRRAGEYVGWNFIDRMAKIRVKYRSQCKFPSRDGAYCAVIGEIEKIEKRVTKTNKPFRTITLKWSPAERFVATLWDSTSDRWPELSLGTIVAVEGKWSRDFSNISVGESQDINVLVKKAP